MITLSESGLTAEQYNALKNLEGDYIYKIIAHNDSFVLDRIDNFERGYEASIITTDDAGNLWVFDAYWQHLQRFNAETETWETVYTFDALPDSFGPPALTVNGDRIDIYLAGNYGILRAYSIDGGTTWSGWQLIYSIAQENRYQYTANLCVGGTASADNVHGDPDPPYYLPSNCFDGSYGPDSGSAFWAADWNGANWIEYQFTSPVYITKYSIWARPDGWLDQSPKAWELQYYNGSSWVTTHYVKDAPAWSAWEKRTYYVQPAAAGINGSGYTRWRLYITDYHKNHTGSVYVLSIGEIEMYGTEIAETVPAIYKLAVTGSRIYYWHEDPTRKIYNLRVVKLNQYGLPASVISSDIWLQALPESFSVATLNGVDYMVFGARIAGSKTYKTEGIELIEAWQAAYGIMTLSFQNDTFSEVSFIETLDVLDDTHLRLSERLSIINGKLTVTAQCADGEVEAFRVYRSVDGRHWSRGVIVSGIVDAYYEFYLVLYAIGDYIYGITANSTYRAMSTYSMGYSPPQMQVDITTHVSDYQISRGTQTQVGFLLDNAGEEYTYIPGVKQHPIISPENRVLFEHFAGIYHETLGEILLPIARTIMDSMEQSSELPEKTIRITARDLLVDLMDYNRSENAVYNHSQINTGDSFENQSNTTHGGMSQTAIQKGEWETADNTLYLNSENVEGIAWNVAGADIVNGAFQTLFSITSGYAGIVFRASNTDNLFYAVYNADSGLLIVAERRAGQDCFLYRAPINEPTGIAVEFQHAMFRVYTTEDDKNWSLALTTYQDASSRDYGTYLDDVSSAPLDKGFVGYIGMGTGISFHDVKLSDRFYPLTVIDTFKQFAARGGLFNVKDDPQFTGLTGSWYGYGNEEVFANILATYGVTKYGDGSVYK